MSIQYSNEYIINEFYKAFENIDTLYKNEIINYRGVTIGKAEKYTEIIARELCNHLDEFEKINKITRKYSYKVNSHDGKTKKKESNRNEERLALDMFGKSYENIGQIIDYQIPINNSKYDKYGKVDLLSEINNDLILIELKANNNSETLLRCVLEIYTYYKQLDLDKLRIDFKKTNANIRKAILVPNEGYQHLEYMKNSFVSELMNKLNIEMFVFKNQNNMIKNICIVNT